MSSTPAAPPPLPEQLTDLLRVALPVELNPATLSLLLDSLCSPTLQTRSLALAATARILAPTPSSRNAQLLRSTIRELLAGTDSNELVKAFTALSALLKVVPLSGQAFLQDEGLRQSLQEAVELAATSRPTGSRPANKNRLAEQLALVELLSLAAGQSGVRAVIRKSAGRWLESMLVSENIKVRGLAGVGVSKLRLGKESPEEGGATAGSKEEEVNWTVSMDRLVDIMADIAIEESKTKTSSTSEEDDDTALLAALEALAYLTLEHSATFKNKLIKEVSFLSSLCSLVTPPTKPHPPHYAVATLLHNLTTYPPIPTSSSEVARLKAYASANAGKKALVETKASVSSRIDTLLSSKSPILLSTLSTLAKSTSVPTRRLVSKIIVSLTEQQQHRSKLLQNGLAKSLLFIIEHVPTETTTDSTSVYEDVVVPAQGIAKLLITTNPSLVFDSTRLGDASRVLGAVVGADWDRDNERGGEEHLIRFECLMALTNIASLSPEMAELIASLQIPALLSTSTPSTSSPSPFLPLLSNLLMSPIPLLTRSATELLCNLSPTSTASEYFATSTSANSTLHIFIALCSSEDEATRLAAGGAIATLVGVPEVATKALTVNGGKGFQSLLKLVDALEEDEGMRLRGYSIIETIAEVGDSEAHKELASAKVDNLLQKAVQNERGSELAAAAAAALQAVRKVVNA